MTDEELITLALDDNEDALKSLHERYFDVIYNYVYLQTRNHHDTEEVVQDCFCKMAFNLHSFDNKSTFKTWFFTICRHTLLDFHRKKKKKSAAPTTGLYTNIASNSRSAEDEAFRHKSPVIDAIYVLKKDYQDVLLLRFVQDLSLAETAEVIGKSVFAVKSLQKRAVKKLLTIVNERVEDYGE
ncbi:RNA polymerase sigma factor [Paenalkalicoccus suaedae]|uniref:RNA polymerase sigma factor n=1 Tax=Paenalkalicoccus suaedae TaxID=2592382 RepID=A0A859FJ98_9BACI|nr:RNA polymerase sigma factor [Paenalkalicoccus suaedae]QKS72716.1 RNA polymerase sigma factor [Paenalkalicoccus suaedae]